MQCNQCGVLFGGSSTRCHICGAARPDLAEVAAIVRKDELVREKARHGGQSVETIGTRTFALPAATPTSAR